MSKKSVEFPVSNTISVSIGDSTIDCMINKYDENLGLGKRQNIRIFIFNPDEASKIKGIYISLLNNDTVFKPSDTVQYSFLSSENINLNSANTNQKQFITVEDINNTVKKKMKEKNLEFEEDSLISNGEKMIITKMVYEISYKKDRQGFYDGAETYSNMPFSEEKQKLSAFFNELIKSKILSENDKISSEIIHIMSSVLEPEKTDHLIQGPQRFIGTGESSMKLQ